MAKALWISRHEATEEQLAEISRVGNTLGALEEGKLLGSRNLATEEDVEKFMLDLHALIRQEEAEAVYGVFAAPIHREIAKETSEIYERRGNGWNDDTVACFSAWNVQRSVEGQKPTFEHKRFVWVGDIYNVPEK